MRNWIIGQASERMKEERKTYKTNDILPGWRHSLIPQQYQTLEYKTKKTLMLHIFLKLTYDVQTWDLVFCIVIL